MSLNEVDASDENTDLRIRKTRRAIRAGFLAVCENKPYDKVTVTDIAPRHWFHEQRFMTTMSTKMPSLQKLSHFSSGK